MRSERAAEWILSLITTRDRAASVVGDFVEEAVTRGRSWFWLSIGRTALAFLWRNVATAARDMASQTVSAFSRRGHDMATARGIGVLRSLWSRKRLVLIPVLVVTAATSVVAYSLPVRYESETSILVVPPRASSDHGRSSVASAVDERMSSIGSELLSRARLERIASDFALYQGGSDSAIAGDAVERMRRDIKVEIIPVGRSSPGISGVKVSFTDTNPRTAMRVTERLASLFIEQNLRRSEMLPQAPTRLIDSEIARLGTELDTSEQRLEQYGTDHAGRAPSRSLTLEYEVLQEAYRTLLVKRQESRLTNLERGEDGEQWRILEPARVPNRPVSPDRLQLTAAGAFSGLGMGLVLVGVSARRRRFD